MVEQTDLQPDLRTDAQRFEDAMKTVLRAPKDRVEAELAKEKEQRWQKAEAQK